ncbi:MAG TPA: type II secretion system protein [Solirubrobacterales bacterium]|nr:type II secretion system protein [Solirubrobacterales bacterium]
MLLQNLRAKIGARLNGDNESGFTLIELLVVMLILGILAAIALPAFFNQRDKAGDAKAKETIHTVQVAMETYATEHSGKYTGATLALLHDIEPAIDESATSPIDVDDDTGDSKYEIKVTSSTGTVFSLDNTEGTLTYDCTAPGKGGCPSPDGDWSK